jgi:hypothetical protein
LTDSVVDRLDTRADSLVALPRSRRPIGSSCVFLERDTAWYRSRYSIVSSTQKEALS